MMDIYIRIVCLSLCHTFIFCIFTLRMRDTARGRVHKRARVTKPGLRVTGLVFPIITGNTEADS